MTVVVAAPGRVLSDSRETGTVKAHRKKIFRTKHGYLVGCAGLVGAWQVLEHCIPWPKNPTVRSLVRMMNKHHSDNPLRDFSEIDLLVVTDKKVFEMSGLAVSEVPVGAIGSGGGWAQGYLRAKPDDLKGAVEAACYYCPFCAGPVQEFEV